MGGERTLHLLQVILGKLNGVKARKVSLDERKIPAVRVNLQGERHSTNSIGEKKPMIKRESRGISVAQELQLLQKSKYR